MPEKFTSPIASAAKEGAGPGAEPSIVLAEARPAGMAQVTAWPETLEAVQAALADLKGAEVLDLGPGRFYVVGDGKDPAPALEARFDAATAAVTDLGHARARFRLTGPAVDDLLLKGVAVDLHPAAFPPGRVAQSAIHGIGVILHRRGESEFDLYCYRGYALSLWEWLTDAALEFGYRVAG